MLTQNQNFDFDVYEYDPMDGSIKLVMRNQVPTTTTAKYQNNVFLSMSNRQSVDNNNHQQTVTTQISSCNDLWSIQNDHTGAWGLLAVPIIDFRQINLRVVLSVASRLPSVSVSDQLSLKQVLHVLEPVT